MKTLRGKLILLHGVSKVGKTQLASKFSGPVVFIATEPGHGYLPRDQKESKINIDPEDGWPDFIKAISSLKAAKPKTVVIDTIAGLYNACFEWVCKQNSWAHPADAGHGRGWSAIRREFYKALNKFAFVTQDMDATMIWIAHSKTEEVETATSVIQKVGCELPGMARSLILPVPDFIWFLTYQDSDKASNSDPTKSLKLVNTDRCLWISGTDQIEAGGRDPEITVKRIAPLSKTDPYKQIIEAINKKAK